jgi:hypothetical protein
MVVKAMTENLVMILDNGAMATVYVESASSQASPLELTELEQLNLKVAAIAEWENIEIWNLNVTKKTFAGNNKKHPELGNFVPDYTSDLNAIFAAFKSLDLKCSVSSSGDAWNFTKDVCGETPAIALCKLLIELTKSEPEI